MNRLELVRKVFETEAEAISKTAQKIEMSQLDQVSAIFDFLTQTGGSLIVTGVGKSGIIAQKISSTFSSLGLPSFFLHPTEALHGDLGRISKNDAIILISKSGSTEELIKLLPFIPIPKDRVIGFIGKIPSSIFDKCGIVFDCSVIKEACLNDLAPTTSTTVTMCIGDALAVLYESQMGISREKFAINHPGGFLGKSLTLKVQEMMIPEKNCPQLTLQSTLQDAILAMTQKPVGLCAIVKENKFLGIIVEGDIRRAFAKNQTALTIKLSEIYNSKPIIISSNVLALNALKLIENTVHSIAILPVVDGEEFKGVLKISDLLSVGFSLSQK